MSDDAERYPGNCGELPVEPVPPVSGGAERKGNAVKPKSIGDCSASRIGSAPGASLGATDIARSAWIVGASIGKELLIREGAGCCSADPWESKGRAFPVTAAMARSLRGQGQRVEKPPTLDMLEQPMVQS